MLLFIEKSDKKIGGNTYSIYRCHCGIEKIINDSKVRSGHTKSCGCLRVRKARERGLLNITHGMESSREYNSWRSMKRRCLNSKAFGYARYGGRGISVCDSWINSFESFYADMGNRPLNTSLDRINNNGNYEPSNCRWSSAKMQQNNRG